MEFNTTDHKQVPNNSGNLKGQKDFPFLQVCTWPFSFHLTEVTFTFSPVSLSIDYLLFGVLFLSFTFPEYFWKVKL